MAFGGMAPTGRRLVGPASDLVEVDGRGQRWTAVVFHENCRRHPALVDAVRPIQNFLAKPLVTGLVALEQQIPDEGAFIYPTGNVWSVAEIVRTLADLGQTGGVRAGLELTYLAAQVLHEASESGPSQGVYSHGNVNPWQIGRAHV